MDWKNTISKDSGLRDSLALYTGVRFVKQNLVSSESLLRIIVFKPHLARRASHYVLYPKFLVNYPFVPLTAFLDLSESVVWNESGTNRETRTNHKRIMNRERIKNTGTNREHPHQWKYGVNPLQWKLAPAVEIRPQWKLGVDPHGGN